MTNPTWGFAPNVPGVSGGTIAAVTDLGTSGYSDLGTGTIAFPKPGAAIPVLTSSSTAAQIVTALQSLGISG